LIAPFSFQGRAQNDSLAAVLTVNKSKVRPEFSRLEGRKIRFVVAVAE